MWVVLDGGHDKDDHVGWKVEEFEAVSQKTAIREAKKLLNGFVAEQRKNSYFEGAGATLYLSLWEGRWRRAEPAEPMTRARPARKERIESKNF